MGLLKTLFAHTYQLNRQAYDFKLLNIKDYSEGARMHGGGKKGRINAYEEFDSAY